MLVASCPVVDVFLTALLAAPPQQLEPAVAQAQRLLGKAQAMAPATQRAAGLEAVGDALELLSRVQGAAASPDVARLRWHLAKEAYRFSAIVLERETWKQVCAYYAQLPARSVDDAEWHRLARQNLARALGRTGFERQAYDLMHEVLQECVATFGPDHDETWEAKWDLATALMGTGPLREAKEIWQSWLQRLQDLPDLEWKKWAVLVHLQNTLWTLGEYEGSLAIRQRILEALAAANAPVDQSFLQARINVAAAVRTCQGTQASYPLIEAVLALAKEHLGAGDEAILRWHANQLALDLRRMGDTGQAIDRLQAAMRVFEQHNPAFEQHPTYHQACRQLAFTFKACGQYQDAIAWHERDLRLRSQNLPAEDTEVLGAMTQLAWCKANVGDVAGAQPLFERVLQKQLEVLGPAALSVQESRGNLAYCLQKAGNYAAARQLLEDSIAGKVAGGASPRHSTLLWDKNLLGWTLLQMGEPRRAVEILREVVARARESAAASVPSDYLDSLALAEWHTGSLADAVATYRQAWADTVREQRSDLSDGLPYYALALAAAGHDAELAQVLTLITNNAWSRLSSLLPLSSREITESARRIRSIVDVGLSLAKEQAVPDARLFELMESLRAASIPVGNVADPRKGGDFVVQLRELREARGQLSDLVASAEEIGDSDARQALQGRIVAATARRDSAEKELAAARGRAGFDPRRITTSDLRAHLRPGEAAVGYHVYRRWTLAAEPPHLPRATDALLALILRSDGAVARCDLGSVDEIAAAIEDWRAAVGKPLLRGRPAAAAKPPDLPAIGKRLRELVLDPVLARAADPKARDDRLTLYVCLDDVLHLVPLDALPLDGRQVVGDRHTLQLLSSFAQLVAPRRQTLVGGSLVAFGGIDFAAEVTAADQVGHPATPPVHGALRSQFYPLLDTRKEVETLAEMFQKHARGQLQANVRTGAEATKRAFHELTPQARYLHLATHGYFAPESIRSLLDGDRARSFGTLADTVQGLAPMTLCGLAFAGAQLGRDASGCVPGIMTAEELASLDLHRCELAVLSACETNVGIRRAGQGISSLQAALQAAGARQAVTSLWQVDDAKTREFMLRFYGNLWGPGPKQTVAQALWNAKQSLRKKADTGVVDWAGWVLTGLER